MAKITIIVIIKLNKMSILNYFMNQYIDFYITLPKFYELTLIYIKKLKK